MSSSRDLIMINGNLVAGDHAKIPAVTSGLYYGAGAFETFLSEYGNIFKLNEHIERLNRGLKYLGATDKQIVNVDELKVQLRTLINKMKYENQIVKIRIQVSLIEKGSYSNDEPLSLLSIITASERKNEIDKIRLMYSDVRLIPSSAKPSILKLSNMLHYRQAYRQAAANGLDDALMLTINNHVGETAVANIFWKRKDKVFTPSEDCDILPGVMRNSIIDILENRMNVMVQKGKFRKENVLNADLVWITNSIKGVVPVSQIDEKTYATDPQFFSELAKQLISYKDEYLTHV